MSSLNQFEYLPTNLRGVDFLPDINIGSLALKHLRLDMSCIDSWYDILNPWKAKVVLYNNLVHTHNGSNVYSHPIIHIVEWERHILRNTPLISSERINVLYFPIIDDIKIVKSMKIIFSRFLLTEHISKYMNIISDMIYDTSFDFSIPIIFNMNTLKIKNIENYFDENIYFTIILEESISLSPIRNKKSISSSNKFALLDNDSESDDEDD